MVRINGNAGSGIKGMILERYVVFILSSTRRPGALGSSILVSLIVAAPSATACPSLVGDTWCTWNLQPDRCERPLAWQPRNPLATQDLRRLCRDTSEGTRIIQVFHGSDQWPPGLATPWRVGRSPGRRRSRPTPTRFHATPPARYRASWQDVSLPRWSRSYVGGIPLCWQHRTRMHPS